jgi:hypothetical protein
MPVQPFVPDVLASSGIDAMHRVYTETGAKLMEQIKISSNLCHDTASA